MARERPKIDRIACPWLIVRFIEKFAESLYVPAAESHATPYDLSAGMRPPQGIVRRRFSRLDDSIERAYPSG